MKTTGMVRRVDSLGRIVLPKEIRRTMKIHDDTPMEIFVDGDQIVLKKYVPEADLEGTLDTFEKELDELCTELGPEKTGSIRKHVRCIRTMINE